MVTKESIVDLLLKNDRAVARALVVLYNRQTLDERQREETRHHNGVGFTGADAGIGTNMATFYLRNGYLTKKQLQFWRQPNKRGIARICKYAGQLLDEAKQKASLKNIS